MSEQIETKMRSSTHDQFQLLINIFLILNKLFFVFGRHVISLLHHVKMLKDEIKSYVEGKVRTWKILLSNGFGQCQHLVTT